MVFLTCIRKLCSSSNKVYLVPILLLLFISLPSAIAQTGDSSDARRELLAVVRIVASPTSSQNGAMDFDSEWTWLQSIYQYRNYTIRNPRLADAWFTIQQNTLQCLLILSRIAEIDKAKPDGVDIFWKIMRDNDTDQQKEDRDGTIITRLLAEVGKSALEDQFRDRQVTLYQSIGALQSLADNLYAYQGFTRGVALDYLPSWQGVYSNDLLEVNNVSGGDFNDAAIFVTVHDQNGETQRHVHYVSQWSNNGLLKVRYPYYRHDYTAPQTGAHPASVDVTVYSEQGVSRATYTLSPQEWEKIVESYCSSLKFRANFLGEYIESQTNQEYYPGVQLSFDGLSMLPVKTVTVSFWTGSNYPTAVQWDYKPGQTLESGTVYPFRSNLFEQGNGALPAGTSPQHIAVALDFYGTNYEQVVRVY